MYVQHGVKIIENIEDIYIKSDLIVKVKEPEDEEIKLIKKSNNFINLGSFKNNNIKYKKCAEKRDILF